MKCNRFLEETIFYFRREVVYTAIFTCLISTPPEVWCEVALTNVEE